MESERDSQLDNHLHFYNVYSTLIGLSLMSRIWRWKKGGKGNKQEYRAQKKNIKKVKGKWNRKAPELLMKQSIIAMGCGVCGVESLNFY